jgi:site-specific DNA recombinase
MQYDVIFAYLRLSRDDKEKIEESNSIKNQKLLIQHFVDNQPEFAGARLLFFADAPDIIGLKQNPTKRVSL